MFTIVIVVLSILGIVCAFKASKDWIFFTSASGGIIAPFSLLFFTINISIVKQNDNYAVQFRPYVATHLAQSVLDETMFARLPFYIPLEHYSLFKKSFTAKELLKVHEENNFSSQEQLRQAELIIAAGDDLNKVYQEKHLDAQYKEFAKIVKKLGLDEEIVVAQN